MTRVTQMGGVAAQGQQPQGRQQGRQHGQDVSQQIGQQSGQGQQDGAALQQQGQDARDPQNRKPTRYTDWAAI